MTDLPLKGLKVADFCWVWTGPTTTRVLADYGATVVKIESKARLDTWRIQPPFKDNIPGPNRGGVFNTINTSKYSVTINISKPKGKELAKRFIKWADIVTENFAGGSMKEMGLGYEVCKELNPGVIMLSSSMMGQSGPWSILPGYGDLLSAISGVTEISGWPDRPPSEIGYYTDFVAPRFNVLTLLTALDYKRRTGKGQYLDIAQYQGGLQYVLPQILDYEVNKRIPIRDGNREKYASPNGLFRCKGVNRYIALSVSNDEEWQTLGKIAGDPPWAGDPKYATLESRKANEDELERDILTWTASQDDKDLMFKLQKAGIGAGYLPSPADFLENDEHLKTRKFYVELDHPEIGKIHAPRQPEMLSETPSETRRAPLIGEHNEEIFKGILGMTDDEIAELVIEEVIY